jgi:hypothetical protein
MVNRLTGNRGAGEEKRETAREMPARLEGRLAKKKKAG